MTCFLLSVFDKRVCFLPLNFLKIEVCFKLLICACSERCFFLKCRGRMCVNWFLLREFDIIVGKYYHYTLRKFGRKYVTHSRRYYEVCKMLQLICLHKSECRQWMISSRLCRQMSLVSPGRYNSPRQQQQQCKHCHIPLTVHHYCSPRLIYSW